MNAALVEASERALAAEDDSAETLIGARIGSHVVTSRIKPGRRWRYVVADTASNRSRLLRGYDLVRLARQARRDGFAVTMPRTPWRDVTAQ